MNTLEDKVRSAMRERGILVPLLVAPAEGDPGPAGVVRGKPKTEPRLLPFRQGKGVNEPWRLR